MMDPIGVIGLGLVGSAISAKLLELGHRVFGLDISADKVKSFARAGGEVATTIAELGDMVVDLTYQNILLEMGVE